MLFLCSENREKPLSEVITTVAPREVQGHRGACLLGPGPPRCGKHVLLPGTEVTHACEAVSPRAPFARRSWLPAPGGSSAETNQMLPRALRGRPGAGTPGLPPPAGLRVPVTPAEDQIRDVCPSGCLRGRPTGKGLLLQAADGVEKFVFKSRGRRPHGGRDAEEWRAEAGPSHRPPPPRPCLP